MSDLGQDILSQLENKIPNINQTHSVITVLNSMLIDEPNNGKILKYLGHCNLILNDFKKSHEYYQQSLSILKTEDPELWYGIGLLYYLNNNFLYSEPSFLRVISLDEDFPKRFSIYFKLGRIYKRYSKYQEAIKYFSLCLKSEESPQCSTQLGFCHDKIDQKDEALNYFKNSYELNKSPYNCLCLAWFIGQKDVNAALEYITRGLLECMKDTVEELDLIYAKARLLYMNKECGEAGNIYNELLNRNSGDYSIWNSFGIMCAELGQHPQAFRCFIKASELSPRAFEVWNNIGSLYSSTGQMSESRQAYNKAKEFSSNPELIKEGSMEYIYTDWDLSELPFISRPGVIKIKNEVKKIESPKPQSMPVNTNAVQQNFVNSYAALIGYMNYARQFSVKKENNSDDFQAAEILSDISKDLPAKRTRDQD